MIEYNRSGKDFKVAKKPKLLVSLSASFAKLSSFVKGKAHRSSKRAKKSTAVVVEASPSAVTTESSALRQYITPNGTTDSKEDDSNLTMPSPVALSLPTDAISPSSSTTAPSTTITSLPREIIRNVMDNLLQIDVICLGLCRKTFWQCAKSHLETEGLYPARFIITDPWGRYSARPLAYYDLPERLETWMSPHVLFHQSTPRMFVENQARANYLKIYFRMCERQLSQPHKLLECLDRLEYKRPIWVLPDCRGFFERWKHLGPHDEEHCAICIESVRAMVPTRSHEALILSHRSNLLRGIVRVINSTFH